MTYRATILRLYVGETQRCVKLAGCMHGPLLPLIFATVSISCGRIGYDAEVQQAVDAQDPGCGVLCPDAATSFVDAVPPLTKTVFVTSQLYTGDLGGLVGADDVCQTLANGAMLPGTYRAWLSDSTGSPTARMTHHDGPYILTDGTVIAANWLDLVDGELLHPINLDESGVVPVSQYVCIDGEIWSNTLTTGDIETDAHCDNWSSSQVGTSSSAGNMYAADASWTDSTCQPVTCAAMLGFYCFEQ